MFCSARNTSGTPWPLTPDSSMTGRPDAFRNAATREEASRGVMASVLFRPISSGFSGCATARPRVHRALSAVHVDDITMRRQQDAAA